MQKPKTLDNKRKFGTPLVEPDDVEVLADEASDEFADYFDNLKVIILGLLFCYFVG